MGMMLMDDMLLPNEYTVTVEFDTKGDTPHEQWLAFERMRVFVTECLDTCIFAHIDNPLVPKLHSSIKTNIVTLFEEPIDMVIGLALLGKLAAITEDRMELFALSISSKLGDQVVNKIEGTDMLAADDMLNSKIKQLTGNSPWWFRTDAGCSDIVLTSKKKVVVKHDQIAWESMQLGWDQPEETVDDKQTPVLKSPKGVLGWKPKIIDGGKS